jgi:hypothetical protein
MTDELVSSRVPCELCGALIAARELPEHTEACRQREHPTRERFE